MSDPIRFNQVFRGDLNKLYYRLGHGRKPYAFVRFGDGERAFCERRPLVTCGEWKYDGSDTKIAQKVDEAVRADIPGFYIGVSCPCCDKKAHRWYLDTVKAPDHRITYANMFVNSNHKFFMRRFKTIPRDSYCLVSCRNGDIKIPKNAIEPEFDYTPVLEKLLKVKKTILIAGGPVKCGLILDYWKMAEDKQIVIDIGSALDKRIHGHPTRRYHLPGSNTSKRVCRWSS